jgi:chromosomal replication initiator protein
MNGSSIQPERAWQMALGQLQMDMPKADFETWVRDTSFVSFEGVSLLLALRMRTAASGLLAA